MTSTVSLLLVGMLISLSSAMYERDVGKRDFYFQNVGLVDNAFFHQNSILVSSTSNVVASINAKTSDIEWRKVYEEETLCTFRYSNDGYILVLTADQKQSLAHVRLYSTSGHLAWEKTIKIQEREEVSGEEGDKRNRFGLDAEFLSGSRFAVLANNVVYIFQTKKVSGSKHSQGTLLLEKSLSSSCDDLQFYHLNGHSRSEHVFAVGRACGKVEVRSISLSGGDVQSTSSSFPISLTWFHSCAKVKDGLVCTTHYDKHESQQLVFVSFSSLEKVRVLQFDYKTEATLSSALSSLSHRLRPFPFASSQAAVEAVDETTFSLSFTSVVTSREDAGDEIVETRVAKIGRSAVGGVTREATREFSEVAFAFSVSDDGHLSWIPTPEKDEATFVCGDGGESEEGKSIFLSRKESKDGSPTYFLSTHVGAKKTHQTSFPVGRLNSQALSPWEGRKIWYDSAHSRVLVKGEDGSLALVSVEAGSARGVWVREEGLSRISASLFTDFPVDKTASEEYKNEFERGFIFKIIQQMTSLVYFVSSSPAKLLAIFQGDRQVVDHALPFKDNFGYRKLIISVTDIGNVFAQHSVGGELIWSSQYPGLSFRNLFLLQKSLDAQYPPQVVLYGLTRSQIWWKITINPWTGEELSPPSPLSFTPVKFIHLSEVASHPWPKDPNDESHSHQTLLLLVEEGNKKVHLEPNTEAAIRYLREYPHPIHYHYEDAERGLLSGHHIQADPSLSTLLSTTCWSKSFSPTSFPTTISSKSVTESDVTTSVLTTTKRKQLSRASESVGEELVTVAKTQVNTISPARVLGDLEVMWKYLNPNLLVVGTTTSRYYQANDDNNTVTNQEDKGEDKANKKGTTTTSQQQKVIRVYLVDIVTGRVLSSFVHKHAYLPLHIVASDNSVYYDFWNAKTHSYQLSVIDLYSVMPGWERKTFSSYSHLTQQRRITGATGSTEAGFNLRTRPNFTFETQAYHSTVSISGLAMSVTSHGITTPQIIVGLASGNVLQIDKRFVDAHRPVRMDMKPTPEDMKEGLRPYQPFLDLSPMRFISYNRTVSSLRSIQTAPTQLESTTLVICHGLDLFYTSMTGGTSYDRLDPTFNSPLFLSGCAAVALLALISHYFYKRHNLQVAWS